MKYAAFLRNVMVGRGGLTREVLLNAFKHCGASNASSFLATGNVIFESDDESAVSIVTRVTKELSSVIGLQEPIFVRHLEALVWLSTANPFIAAPTDDIYERCVTFLPSALTMVDGLPFHSRRRDFEVFAATGTEAFSVTRRIDGRPGQPGKWIEEKVGVRVTTRNWNTIERILKKHA